MVDIGKANFQILSPQQANPIARGLSDSLADILKMQQSQVNKARMPYVGAQAAANLQRTQLQNQWYAPEKQARIAQTNANTSMRNILNQYLPQQQQLSLLAQSLASKLAQANLPYAQQLDQARINLMGAQANRLNNPMLGGGRSGAGVNMQILNGLKGQLSFENPDWDSAKIDQYASAYLNGSSALPDGTPLPAPSGSVKYILDSAEMKRQPAAATNQQRYASTLEQAFDNANKIAPSAFKFSGAAGQAKLKLAEAQAATGGYDPDYQNYLMFTHQTVPLLASEIMKTGGVNQSDMQKLTAMKQVNPISGVSNPDVAMQQFKYLQSLYSDIDKTISQTPSEIKASLNSGGNKTTPEIAAPSSMSPKDQKIEDLLKQHPNLTRDQITTIIGG